MVGCIIIIIQIFRLLWHTLCLRTCIVTTMRQAAASHVDYKRSRGTAAVCATRYTIILSLRVQYNILWDASTGARTRLRMNNLKKKTDTKTENENQREKKESFCTKK